MKEIIDLYDVNREHTGLTAVRGEKLPEGTYRMVVHVCIFNNKGEMLIQKRADGDVLEHLNEIQSALMKKVGL